MHNMLIFIINLGINCITHILIFIIFNYGVSNFLFQLNISKPLKTFENVELIIMKLFKWYYSSEMIILSISQYGFYQFLIVKNGWNWLLQNSNKNIFLVFLMRFERQMIKISF